MKKFRTKYIIFPKFQYPIIILMVTNFAFLTVFLYLRVSSIFNQIKELILKANFGEDHPFFKLLAYNEDLLTKDILIILGTFFVFLLLSTIYISHKLAGPIYRLQSYFKQVQKNPEDYKNLKFRKGDYIEDMAQDILQSFEKVKTQMPDEGANN